MSLYQDISPSRQGINPPGRILRVDRKGEATSHHHDKIQSRRVDPPETRNGRRSTTPSNVPVREVVINNDDEAARHGVPGNLRVLGTFSDDLTDDVSYRVNGRYKRNPDEERDEPEPDVPESNAELNEQRLNSKSKKSKLKITTKAVKFQDVSEEQKTDERRPLSLRRKKFGTISDTIDSVIDYFDPIIDDASEASTQITEDRPRRKPDILASVIGQFNCGKNISKVDDLNPDSVDDTSTVELHPTKGLRVGESNKQGLVEVTGGLENAKVRKVIASLPDKFFEQDDRVKKSPVKQDKSVTKEPIDLKDSIDLEDSTNPRSRHQNPVNGCSNVLLGQFESIFRRDEDTVDKIDNDAAAKIEDDESTMDSLLLDDDEQVVPMSQQDISQTPEPVVTLLNAVTPHNGSSPLRDMQKGKDPQRNGEMGQLLTKHFAADTADKSAEKTATQEDPQLAKTSKFSNASANLSKAGLHLQKACSELASAIVAPIQGTPTAEATEMATSDDVGTSPNGTGAIGCTSPSTPFASKMFLGCIPHHPHDMPIDETSVTMETTNDGVVPPLDTAIDVVLTEGTSNEVSAEDTREQQPVGRKGSISAEDATPSLHVHSTKVSTVAESDEKDGVHEALHCPSRDCTATDVDVQIYSAGQSMEAIEFTMDEHNAVQEKKKIDVPSTAIACTKEEASHISDPTSQVDHAKSTAESISTMHEELEILISKIDQNHIVTSSHDAEAKEATNQDMDQTSPMIIVEPSNLSDAGVPIVEESFDSTTMLIVGSSGVQTDLPLSSPSKATSTEDEVSPLPESSSEPTAMLKADKSQASASQNDKCELSSGKKLSKKQRFPSFSLRIRSRSDPKKKKGHVKDGEQAVAETPFAPLQADEASKASRVQEEDVDDCIVLVENIRVSEKRDEGILEDIVEDKSAEQHGEDGSCNSVTSMKSGSDESVRDRPVKSSKSGKPSTPSKKRKTWKKLISPFRRHKKATKKNSGSRSPNRTSKKDPSLESLLENTLPRQNKTEAQDMMLQIDEGSSAGGTSPVILQKLACVTSDSDGDEATNRESATEPQKTKDSPVRTTEAVATAESTNFVNLKGSTNMEKRQAWLAKKRGSSYTPKIEDKKNPLLKNKKLNIMEKKEDLASQKDAIIADLEFTATFGVSATDETDRNWNDFGTSHFGATAEQSTPASTETTNVDDDQKAVQTSSSSPTPSQLDDNLQAQVLSRHRSEDTSRTELVSNCTLSRGHSQLSKASKSSVPMVYRGRSIDSVTTMQINNLAMSRESYDDGDTDSLDKMLTSIEDAAITTRLTDTSQSNESMDKTETSTSLEGETSKDISDVVVEESSDDKENEANVENVTKEESHDGCNSSISKGYGNVSSSPTRHLGDSSWSLRQAAVKLMNNKETAAQVSSASDDGGAIPQKKIVQEPKTPENRAIRASNTLSPSSNPSVTTETWNSPMKSDDDESGGRPWYKNFTEWENGQTSTGTTTAAIAVASRGASSPQSVADL